MSAAELVAFVCCDLGSIVRGRSLPAAELGGRLDAGVGWVPANHSLTPLGDLAEPNPFGSTGDLRLLPDPDTHVRVEAGPGESPLEFLLCDITETDGRAVGVLSAALPEGRPAGARGRAGHPRAWRASSTSSSS